MLKPYAKQFNAAAFLANAGPGRKIVFLKAKEPFFLQGTPANSIFYLQEGRAKLTVVSEAGKEARISLLSEGHFIGEEVLACETSLRMAEATAVTSCTALEIDRIEMVRVLHEEQAFADIFLAFLLAREMRTQVDLVDQLFDSSEKQLAGILLLMAKFNQAGEPEIRIPQITQRRLAEMSGITRSRVSFLMDRFRSLGYIDYKRRITVHNSLLNVVLHDQTVKHNAESPPLFGFRRGSTRLPTQKAHS